MLYLQTKTSGFKTHLYTEPYPWLKFRDIMVFLFLFRLNNEDKYTFAFET